MSKPSIIRPASELLLPYGINMMLYSDPGVGKTPFIATGANTLILDADLGAESAFGSKAELWPVQSWVDLDEAYDWLRHERHEYKWVWMDGISIGQERLLTGIMEDLVSQPNKGHRKVWQADKGEYGQNMFRFKQWVQHMAAQPFNFGITAHPFRWEDPVTGEDIIMPWIQGKNMSPTVCGMMNIIGYMTGAWPEVSLYTRKKDNYYARDKFNALGAGMKNATIPKVEARVMATIKEAQAAHPGSNTPTRPRPPRKATVASVTPIRRRAPK